MLEIRASHSCAIPNSERPGSRGRKAQASTATDCPVKATGPRSNHGIIPSRPDPTAHKTSEPETPSAPRWAPTDFGTGDGSRAACNFSGREARKGDVPPSGTGFARTTTVRQAQEQHRVRFLFKTGIYRNTVGRPKKHTIPNTQTPHRRHSRSKSHLCNRALNRTRQPRSESLTPSPKCSFLSLRGHG